MYAIIKCGGKQYKVSKGEELVVDHVDAEVDSKFDITDVIMIRDESVIVDGLDKVKVVASVVEHFKGDKILVFKYKSKKNYRRKQGHRQPYTKVLVEALQA